MDQCTNLYNYTILVDKPDNEGNESTVSVNLSEVYKGNYVESTNFNFYFNQALIQNIGFDRLKRFYNASGSNPWSNPANAWDSSVTIAYANKLRDDRQLGQKCNLPKITVANKNEYRNYLKFVNCLVGLYGYKSASYTEEFVRNLYIDFLVANYEDGRVFIENMAKHYLGTNLKGGNS